MVFWRIGALLSPSTTLPGIPTVHFSPLDIAFCLSYCFWIALAASPRALPSASLSAGVFLTAASSPAAGALTSGLTAYFSAVYDTP